MSFSYERFQVFSRAFEQDLPQDLAQYGAYAREGGVPIIRDDTARFLRTLLSTSRPLKILEVGTAIGYSALLFCRFSPQAMHLTTIEVSKERAEKAREAFERFGVQNKITLLEGDATRILPLLEGSYDLIFMDAAKGQYYFWLPEIRRLLHTGSLLISDNILQEGEILESRYLVERRDRTRYQRMRDYLFALTHEEGLETTLLPIGDGLALTVLR